MLALIVFFFALSCSENNIPKYIENQRFYMDTVISLKIPECKNSEKIFSEVFSEFERIDKKYSKTYTSSVIFKINNRVENSIEIDSETIDLIDICLDYHKMTFGYFDITMFTIGQFWNFNTEEDTDVPAKIKKSIDYLKYAGADKIKIDGSKIIFENMETKIDLGAVAKGYAINKGLETLKKNKAQSALINAGGEIFAHNLKFGKVKWNVAIQDPDAANSFLKVLKLSDKCVSTSGTYNRFVKFNGKNFAHIFNPKTGKNVDYFKSFSIIANDGLTADIISTALLASERDYLKVWNTLKKNKPYLYGYAKKDNSDLIEFSN